MFTASVKRSRTPRLTADPVPAPAFVDFVSTTIGYVGFTLNAAGDTTLDWGDGNSDTVLGSASPSFNHTYVTTEREASLSSTQDVNYCAIDAQVSAVHSVNMAANAFSLLATLDLAQTDNSPLTSINLLPFTELVAFNAVGGGFNEAAVDQILADLVANGKLSGFVNITNSVPPGAAGDADALTLVGRGWTVQTD